MEDPIFPSDIDGASDMQRRVSRFLGLHKKAKDGMILVSSCSVVVVTAGGMAVPLELNTVRSLDTRKIRSSYEFEEKETIGCALAEHYLLKGFRVVYLHRKGSNYFPFTSSYRWMFNSDCHDKENDFSSSRASPTSLSIMNYHDFLQINMNSSRNNGNLKGYELIGCESDIHRSLQTKKNPSESLFLPVSYETIHQYFALLEYLFQIARIFGPQMSFCLTANVPKYYIPLNKVRTVFRSTFFSLSFLVIVLEYSRLQLIKCNQTNVLSYLWKGLLIQSRNT
jgi:hypothetical protein